MPSSAPVRPAPTELRGSVELTLAMRDGLTRLVGSRTRPPLLVQRALYPDRALPHLALVMLANPTGGIFQGDHHHITITVESGAAGHVTTQSSTKVHSMPYGRARQNVGLVVASIGHLEYLPDPVIPYHDSDIEQYTTISVAPGGTLVFWDILTPGRTAMGESFRYRLLANRLEVLAGAGGTAYRESFEIVPSRHYPLVRGMLGAPRSEQRGSTLGSMLVIAELGRLEPLVVELQESLPSDLEITAGVTRLPNQVGLGIRVIGWDTADVQTVLVKCWSVLRCHLLGVDLPFLRKY